MLLKMKKSLLTLYEAQFIFRSAGNIMLIAATKYYLARKAGEPVVAHAYVQELGGRDLPEFSFVSDGNSWAPRPGTGP